MNSDEWGKKPCKSFKRIENKYWTTNVCQECGCTEDGHLWPEEYEEEKAQPPKGPTP